MHTIAPCLAGELFNTLRQAVYDSVAWRGLYHAPTDVDREAAYSGTYSGELQLRVTLSQRQFHRLPISYVVGDAAHAYRYAVSIVFDRTHNRDPAQNI